MKPIALELPMEDRAKVLGTVPVNPVLVLLALALFLSLFLAGCNVGAPRSTESGPVPPEEAAS